MDRIDLPKTVTSLKGFEMAVDRERNINVQSKHLKQDNAKVWIDRENSLDIEDEYSCELDR